MNAAALLAEAATLRAAADRLEALAMASGEDTAPEPAVAAVAAAEPEKAGLGKTLTIGQAAGLAEKVTGRPVHYSTVRRWLLNNQGIIGRQLPTGGWIAWESQFTAFLLSDGKNATFANGVPDAGSASSST